MGPLTARLSKAPGFGPCATTPGLGRRPTTEQKLAGMRRLPPRSLPFASHAIPVASATAEPPEEPPQVIAVFQGLRVLPNTSLKVLAPAANSGTLERASTMPPWRSSVSTWRSERSGTKSAKIGEPWVERTPMTFIESLIAIGSPPSQPAAPRSGVGATMRRA